MALEPFYMLVKPIGSACNMACKYCFYLEKSALYPHKPGFAEWALPETVLEEYIRQYIGSQTTPVISFAWQGGEPTLLGVEYFHKVVELQKKYADGKRIENALQTNGILLDDEWCEFLAQNRFLVGLSIDGPKELHDCYRIDKGGGPSYDKVMRAMECLKRHRADFNTLTVVHRRNSTRPLEVYHFLKETGSGFMQFIPVVERIPASPSSNASVLVSPHSSTASRIADWSVEPLQYGKFLCAIFDEWVRNDVGRIFIRIFDSTLASWSGVDPGLCLFQRTCGAGAILEHNGDVYSCDHFVYPENKLGNIMESSIESLLQSQQQVRFGQDKLDRLPKVCLTCSARFACNGECPKHRIVRAPDGGENLNYFCPAYKLFFAHVEPYMEFMAAELRAERPPSNVIEWARERDLNAALDKRPGRNDPCPCGSGLKFKRCCGKT